MGHELAADRARFNVPLVLKLVGDLVPEALTQSLDAVLRRHAVLRSTYGLCGEELMQTAIAAMWLKPAFVDLTQLPEAEAVREADRLIGAEIVRPFDLSRDLMLRAKLLRVGAAEYRLVITRHHIASDGWSLGILLSELVHFYRAFCGGRPGRLRDLTIQYGDYAHRQRTSIDAAAIEGSLQYWRRQLAGADPRLFAAVCDAAAPAGAVVHGRIDAAVAQAARAWCRRSGMTLFQALLAAFVVVLHHRTGRTDIVVATDYTQRNHKEVEGLIGTFVDRLPLRLRLEGDPDLGELARRVGETTFAAYAHADAPYADIVAAFGRPQAPGDALFHAMFGLHAVPGHAPYRTLRLHGLQSNELLETSIAHSEFPLGLYVTDAESALLIEMRHDTRYIPAEHARIVLRQFENVLRHGLGSPAPGLGRLGALADASVSSDSSAFLRVRASAWARRRAQSTTR